MLNIYLIKRTDQVDYDENIAHIVAALGDEEVRYLAAAASADEGPAIWFDAGRSTIQLIGTAARAITEPQIILTNDLNG